MSEWVCRAKNANVIELHSLVELRTVSAFTSHRLKYGQGAFHFIWERCTNRGETKWERKRESTKVILILVMSWHEKYDYFVHCSHLVAFFIIIYLFQSGQRLAPNTGTTTKNTDKKTRCLHLLYVHLVEFCIFFSWYLLDVLNGNRSLHTQTLHTIAYVCVFCDRITRCCARNSTIYLKSQSSEWHDYVEIGTDFHKNYAKCDKKFGSKECFFHSVFVSIKTYTHTHTHTHTQ